MARGQKSLVCQHIEYLSSDALERYAEIIREIVGRRHGVYALYRGRKLYYVGLARDLRVRLNTHLRDRHGGLWDGFSVYLTIDDAHLRELESLVMRIAQPQGNKQRGKLRRSEDLMSLLQQRLKERQRHEIRSLTERAPSPQKTRAAKRRKEPAPGAPALARYVESGLTLRATHKGVTYAARVRRDGSIRVKGKVVASPSVAATVVTGTSVNGWAFWRYERAPGQWVRLAELRRG